MRRRPVCGTRDNESGGYCGTAANGPKAVAFGPDFTLD